MRVSENLSILFLLEKSEMSKDGRAPIYARITLNGQRKEISLGIKILPEQWDQESGRVSGNTADVFLMNSQITQAKANLEKHYFILTTQYDYVTADMVKKSYQGKLLGPSGEEEQQEKKTLLAATDFEITRFRELVQKGLRSSKTLKKWESTKTKLIAFILYHFKKADVPLEIIKPSFGHDLLHYLTTVDDLEPNSAMKYVKNVKQVLTTATGRWISSSPLKDFRCSYAQPKREFLTIHEILKIYRKPLIAGLDEVRNVFLFCCFTGFAYQDVYNLTLDDIKLGNDGGKWIDTERLKTGNNEAVPLLPVAAAIIEKYKGNKYCEVNNVLLPVNSNYRFNAYLKEIADLCGISKKLTTHIARHTFATTVTLCRTIQIFANPKQKKATGIHLCKRITECKKGFVELSGFVASWNMAWEVAHLRYDLFSEDIPQEISGKLRGENFGHYS